MKASLLRKNQYLFALILILLTMLGGVALWAGNHYFLEQVKTEHLQQQQALLLERIDKKEKVLHGVTVTLANSSVLLNALTYEDREALIDEMANLPEQFKQWTGFKNYAFHAITQDGRSFYKSYDPDSYGQDVRDHPMMQQAIANTSKAVTKVDKGGYGNIFRVINIQPMFALSDATELVGFMTVSQGLGQVVKEFAAELSEYYVFEYHAQSSVTGQSSGEKENHTFTIDSGDYFQNRPLSNWTFTKAQLNHQTLQLHDGWYYQTLPILNQQNDLQAFHLIAVPQNFLNHQAWLKTQQVLWVILLAIFIVVIGGVIQLKLLKNNVLKPMRALNQAINKIIKTEKYDQLVPVVRGDEIGQVSTQFNALLKKTSELIFDLNYQKVAIDQTLIISRANQFGTITYVNDNFCKISGYTRQELVGQPHSIVRHPSTASTLFKQLWQTIQKRKIWQGEIQNQRKDGTSYYVISYIIPILNAQGELVEYLSIREDITLVVELREGLQQAVIQAQNEKEIAQKASQAKSEFLSSMSHEFRTPLNAIIGYAQLLALSNLPTAQQNQLAIIGSSGQHLLQLVNQILDLAKLESGKISFYLEAVNTKEVINEAYSLIELSAQQRGIHFELNPVPQGELIFVDRLRFKQVVLNLLNNAIKYNKPNGKTIITCQILTNENSHFWELSVRDTGVGIAQGHLEQLFQPFNRLGHENSNIQGTGIGLSITKDLIEQMHGYITVNSTLGQGSEFKVGFPLYQGQSELVGQIMPNQSNANSLALESAASSKTSPSQTPAGLRVLFMADDSASMDIMVSAIEEVDGAELKIAPTLKNGLEQAKTWPPQLMFIAIALSGPEHDELLKHLCTMPELTKTQFCFIGSNDQVEYMPTDPLFKHAIFLTKPLKRTELIAIVRKSQ